MALRPSQVRRMLQDDNMPVDDAPPDEGDGAPRQSYNFAPGYYGVIYRADVPDRGAGTGAGASAGAGDGREHGHGHEHGDAHARPHAPGGDEGKPARYRLQSMKWGLVPFWTKRSKTTGYGAVLKTVNCRDDSLAAPGGLWAPMKARKRCVVLAEGFYEWLKRDGGRTKIPHYVRRRDGKLMCFAGLWDCARYDDDDGGGGENTDQPPPLYTYTIITTASNDRLRFLHDRMPVILDPGSDAMRAWLDPARHVWSAELQALLRPFDGDLDVYPVSKDVGKVGNESPSFVVPVASRENKANIANFFAAARAAKTEAGSSSPPPPPPPSSGEAEVKPEPESEVEVEIKKEPGSSLADDDKAEVEIEPKAAQPVDELDKTGRDGAGMGSPPPSARKGVKREREVDASPPIKKEEEEEEEEEEEPPAKRVAVGKAASPARDRQAHRGKISATSNRAAGSPVKVKAKAKAKAAGSLDGGQKKITTFFANSA